MGEEPPPRYCIKKEPYDPRSRKPFEPGPMPIRAKPNLDRWDHCNTQAGTAHRNLGRRRSSPSQRAQRGLFWVQIPGFEPWPVGITNDRHITELSLSLHIIYILTWDTHPNQPKRFWWALSHQSIHTPPLMLLLLTCISLAQIFDVSI